MFSFVFILRRVCHTWWWTSFAQRLVCPTLLCICEVYHNLFRHPIQGDVIAYSGFSQWLLLSGHCPSDLLFAMSSCPSSLPKTCSNRNLRLGRTFLTLCWETTREPLSLKQTWKSCQDLPDTQKYVCWCTHSTHPPPHLVCYIALTFSYLQNCSAWTFFF